MPDLFDLIYKNRENEHEEVRWSLLTWMFNLETQFCQDLMELPKTLKPVVLTLQYLIQVLHKLDLNTRHS